MTTVCRDTKTCLSTLTLRDRNQRCNLADYSVCLTTCCRFRKCTGGTFEVWHCRACQTSVALSCSVFTHTTRPACGVPQPTSRAAQQPGLPRITGFMYGVSQLQIAETDLDHYRWRFAADVIIPQQLLDVRSQFPWIANFNMYWSLYTKEGLRLQSLRFGKRYPLV